MNKESKSTLKWAIYILFISLGCIFSPYVLGRFERAAENFFIMGIFLFLVFIVMLILIILDMIWGGGDNTDGTNPPLGL